MLKMKHWLKEIVEIHDPADFNQPCSSLHANLPLETCGFNPIGREFHGTSKVIRLGYDGIHVEKKEMGHILGSEIKKTGDVFRAFDDEKTLESERFTQHFHTQTFFFDK